MKNILVAHLRGQKVPKLALFVVFILFTSFYIIYRQPNTSTGKRKNNVTILYRKNRDKSLIIKLNCKERNVFFSITFLIFLEVHDK